MASLVGRWVFAARMPGCLFGRCCFPALPPIGDECLWCVSFWPFFGQRCARFLWVGLVVADVAGVKLGTAPGRNTPVRAQQRCSEYESAGLRRVKLGAALGCSTLMLRDKL